MTNRTTAAEWLKIPEDDLGVALAEVLTEKPWEHDVMDNPSGANVCAKCELKCFSGNHHINPCSVPGPSDVKDWNVAMREMRKCDRDEFLFAAWKVSNLYPDRDGRREKILEWCVFLAQPRELLIVAAIAAGRNEE